VGYTGGTLKNPTYHNLGDHTESVEIDYDPVQTNYSALLRLFWEHHESTVKRNRQYMSAIFYHSPEEKQEAEETMKDQQKKTVRPIVTQILPAGQFYAAEDYHQKYRLQQHPWLVAQLGVEENHLFNSHAISRINGYAAGHGSLAVFEHEWPLLGVTEEVAEYLRKIVKNGPALSCS
jgi:peptide-methionine (S)-S-oxide reductase